MPTVCHPLYLADLPSPPAGKVGFPWTEQSTPLSNQLAPRPDCSPRISIITPSYNQGHFIEETIRSVLLQSYPNLEYIIVDGDSTDNTVEIIRKYGQFLTYWVSEEDRGQAHAINKGLERATGDILAYLNSDDYYLPKALHKAAQVFVEHPETDLLHGRCRYVNESGEKIGTQFGDIQTFEEIIDLWDVWWKNRQFVQPEVFWSKRIGNLIGSFNESLNFAMDYEYWCRILKSKGKVAKISSELSCFRFTAAQKSNNSELVSKELLSIVHPMIFKEPLNLPTSQRLTMEAKWLYQSIFLNKVKQSVELGDHKLMRWWKIARIILKHPSLILAPRLHQRVKEVFFPFH